MWLSHNGNLEIRLTHNETRAETYFRTVRSSSQATAQMERSIHDRNFSGKAVSLPTMAATKHLTWPSEKMAKFIDLTPRRLRQLVDEGVVPREERGCYNPFAVMVAYIRFLRDRRKRRTRNFSRSSWRNSKLSVSRSNWRTKSPAGNITSAMRFIFCTNTFSRSSLKRSRAI
jgi:hypothetical protein